MTKFTFKISGSVTVHAGNLEDACMKACEEIAIDPESIVELTWEE